ncbi:MAG TPA: diguanylate cyclase [Stellaceae bacterium]|nr:diguanylate cyclase [Stellaceae bacterium]
MPNLTLRPDRGLAVRMTRAYVAALTAIALLSAGIHLILSHVIDQQHDAATVINVAGRQRMLSQRIALLGSDLATGDESARVPLAQAADLMERSHRALIHGGDLGITNRPSPEVGALFFGGSSALDAEVPAYVATARTVLAAPDAAGRTAAALRLRHDALGSLLPDLDRVVGTLEGESNARVVWLLRTQKVVLAILLSTLAAEALFVFRPLVRRTHAYATRLYELATRDSLTGLPNRLFFLDAAEREFLLARREKRPLGMLMIDIDHFKHVNDRYGHATGDGVLRRFAETAQTALRRSDVIGRTGGEEFCVVLPSTPIGAAVSVAEKLRDAVQADCQTDLPAVTVSIGAAALGPDDADFASLAKRADAALYEAKCSARNRVALADETARAAEPGVLELIPAM